MTNQNTQFYICISSVSVYQFPSISIFRLLFFVSNWQSPLNLLSLLLPAAERVSINLYFCTITCEHTWIYVVYLCWAGFNWIKMTEAGALPSCPRLGFGVKILQGSTNPDCREQFLFRKQSFLSQSLSLACSLSCSSALFIALLSCSVCHCLHLEPPLFRPPPLQALGPPLFPQQKN